MFPPPLLYVNYILHYIYITPAEPEKVDTLKLPLNKLLMGRRESVKFEEIIESSQIEETQNSSLEVVGVVEECVDSDNEISYRKLRVNRGVSINSVSEDEKSLSRNNSNGELNEKLEDEFELENGKKESATWVENKTELKKMEEEIKPSSKKSEIADMEINENELSESNNIKPDESSKSESNDTNSDEIEENDKLPDSQKTVDDFYSPNNKSAKESYDEKDDEEIPEKHKKPFETSKFEDDKQSENELQDNEQDDAITEDIEKQPETSIKNKTEKESNDISRDTHIKKQKAEYETQKISTNEIDRESTPDDDPVVSDLLKRIQKQRSVLEEILTKEADTSKEGSL